MCKLSACWEQNIPKMSVLSVLNNKLIKDYIIVDLLYGANGNMCCIYKYDTCLYMILIWYDMIWYLYDTYMIVITYVILYHIYCLFSVAGCDFSLALSSCTAELSYIQTASVSKPLEFWTKYCQ